MSLRQQAHRYKHFKKPGKNFGNIDLDLDDPENAAPIDSESEDEVK